MHITMWYNMSILSTLIFLNVCTVLCYPMLFAISSIHVKPRYHGPMACSLTLEAALQSCAAFLQEHHSEFLILRALPEATQRMIPQPATIATGAHDSNQGRSSFIVLILGRAAGRSSKPCNFAAILMPHLAWCLYHPDPILRSCITWLSWP